MQLKVEEGFGEITSHDIKLLELQIGKILPIDYIKFLKKNNGGRLEPSFFKTEHGEIEGEVHFMFGITSQYIYDLGHNYKKWTNLTNLHNMLPIGMDTQGDFILLDLQNEEAPIFLWLHDSEDNLILAIEPSFSSFLKNLFLVEESLSDVDTAIAGQNIDFFESRFVLGENLDNLKTQYGQPVVLAAASNNKLYLLEYFHKRKLKMGMALFSAASIGHVAAVNFLLSIGLPADERDVNQNNDTALMQASFGGYLEVVKLLVSAGADINAKDIHGQTVLRKALWSNNQLLVEFLEKSGAQLS